jgi:acyl carrier protein
MTRNDVWSALVAAIREELDRPDLVIEPGMTADDIPGWDSLAHVRIVLNAEDRTSATVDMKATYGAADVDQLCELLLQATS